MNSVVLIGRLTRDPELSYTPNNQTAVCHFTLAVDRPRRNGEDAGADFIRITVWGKQAENCDKYIAKGRQVAVLGRIQTGSYKNRDGVTVNTTEVVAERVEFLSSGQGSASRNTGFSEGPVPTFDAPAQSIDNAMPSGFENYEDMPDSFQAADDDIPF